LQAGAYAEEAHTELVIEFNTLCLLCRLNQYYNTANRRYCYCW